MAEIGVRTYLQQIESLVDQKQLDEAIAHCRHLLAYYPKNLHTYRLLGKALLEKGRHGDAADIFQRILSAVPDDFVAHVGMSIVREDEANLTAALWHMERAFEANPSNAAIQEELRRLYGRRDGSNPTRARLTRGALARQYVRGELFPQAEAELRSALQADPERFDLSLILAHVLWQTNQRAEAVERCDKIVKDKLPYSEVANRILADYWISQGRPDDSLTYRQRLEALDPYEAFTDGQEAGQVNADAVRVPQLEYTPDMAEQGMGWVSSFDESAEEEPATPSGGTPDWLASSGVIPDETPFSGDVPVAAEVPDWLKGMEPAASSAPPPELPGWMKATTGQLKTGSLQDQEKKSISSRLRPVEKPSDAQPTKAQDMPEWMRTSALTADLGKTGETPPWLAGQADEKAEPKAEPPEWMKSEAPTTAFDAALEPPEWLKTTALETDALPTSEADTAGIKTTALETSDEEPISPEPIDELPDWMKTSALKADDKAPDLDKLPDWMRTSALKADEKPPDLEALPDWMQADAPIPGPSQPAAPPADEAGDEAIAPASEDELPDWMKGAAGSAAPAADEDLPDWMKTPAVEPEPKTKAEPAPASQPPVELPDFLTLASPEAIARAEERYEPEAGEESENWLAEVVGADTDPDEVAPAEAGDVPDWIQAMRPPEPEPPQPKAEKAPPAPPPAQPEPEPAAAAAEMGDDEAFDWLEKLAAQQGARPEELVGQRDADAPSEPEPPQPAPTGELPGWLRKPAEPKPEPEANEDLPDWVKASSQPASASDTIGVFLKDKKVPDWVQPPGEKAKPPATDWLRAPLEKAAGDDRPQGEPALPDWLAKSQPAKPADEPKPPPAAMDDADAAMRWLESLAAQQGARPEELVTQPDERTDQAPDWVKAQAPEPKPEAAPEPQPEARAPETPEPEVFESAPDDADAAMRWLESLAAQQGARPEELVTRPDERTDQAPDWVKAQTPEPKPEAAPEPQPKARAPETPEPEVFESAPDDADEAMRWLESLAAQHGARPEELVTRPDERTDQAPDWVKAQAAEPPRDAIEIEAEPEASPVDEVPADLPAEDIPEWLKASGQVDEEAPATPADDLPDWIRAAGPAVPIQAEPEPPPPAAAPAPAPEPPAAKAAPPTKPAEPAEPADDASSDVRLARLAERLASSRRAKDDEIARRFEEQRLQQEEARRAVAQAIEDRRASRTSGTGPLAGKPGTGPLGAKPGTGPLGAKPGTGPLGEKKSEADKPQEAVAPPEPVRITIPPRIGTPGTKKRGKKSPYASEPREAVYDIARQALSDRQYETAAEAFDYLISTSSMIGEVTSELETFVARQPNAPDFVRLLGDAYMKGNQLQKALDAYRQALGQL